MTIIGEAVVRRVVTLGMASFDKVSAKESDRMTKAVRWIAYLRYFRDGDASFDEAWLAQPAVNRYQYVPEE